MIIFRSYLALHDMREFKMYGVSEVLRELTTLANSPLPCVILCTKLKSTQLFCHHSLCSLSPMATHKHFNTVSSYKVHMTSLWLMITILTNSSPC